MFADWEPPTSHCMTVAVGKWFDRAHGTAKKKIQLRLPPTWAVLAHGRKVVASMEDGGYAIWLGLAVSYYDCAVRQSCGRTETDNFTPRFS